MEQSEDRLAALRKGDADAIRAWIVQYAHTVQDIGLAYLGSPEEATAFSKRILTQALQSIAAGYTPSDMEDWLISLARSQASQAALAKPAQPLPPLSPQPVLRSAGPLQPPVPKEVPTGPCVEEDSPTACVLACEDLAIPSEPNFEADDDLQTEDSPPPLEAAPASSPSIPLLFSDEEDSVWDDEPLIRRTSPFKRFFGVLFIFLLLMAVLGLLWGLAGLLMDLNILPEYDLGYRWFNAAVYPFF
ncbi:MAG: hypothetical protein VB049_02010 [Candidatus Pelethousia sp.]|nr:hypothetical protein [Candidatus Pelethousia sp.]